MRPIVVQVGPLATASANNIATAQRNFGAGGALALLGATSDFVAGTIAASQAPGASALTLNGTRALNGVAYTNGSQYIYISSTGNDSGITFSVVGVSGLKNIVVKETINGTNAQAAASVNPYSKILSITPSGAVAANVSVGTFAAAKLDTARRVLFTTVGNESANTAVITGSDSLGNSLIETVALANAGTSQSALDYYYINKITITSAAAGNISVGTSTVASSPWARMDDWAPGPITAQFSVTGTVNYDVQTSQSDPNYPVSVGLSSMVWDSQIAGIMGAVASTQVTMQANPLFVRIVLNSGTGSVSGTIAQAGVNPA
jgi:hypothetical protein